MEAASTLHIVPKPRLTSDGGSPYLPKSLRDSADDYKLGSVDATTSIRRNSKQSDDQQITCPTLATKTWRWLQDDPPWSPLATITMADSPSFGDGKESKAWETSTKFDIVATPEPAANDSCSGDTDASQHVSPESDSRMLFVHSKHQLMVRLMQEVYVMFDKRWSVDGKSRASSEASGSSSPARQQDSANGSQNYQRPAQKRGRDEQDPDDDKMGKRRRSDRQDALTGRKVAFACPYHQKDPIKYSCNSTTGLKYRACMGPGFENISRLKQHLKRVHKAPIQCTRCWMTMRSLQAMSEHANRPIRCEACDPNPQGISQDKMDLISGKWGASWESIFEILFPGAPILRPYYEPALLGQSNGPPSPGSQELSDFETYSRTELPRLIEANLQAMVDAEIGPLEENIKSLVMDVVRRCQSTLAQNYGRIKSSSTENTATKTKQNAAPTAEAAYQPISITQNTDLVQSSFEEPPFRDLPILSQELAVTTDWAAMNPLHVESSFPSLHSDSGYGTVLDDFDCCQCGDSQAMIPCVDGICTACGFKRPITWSLDEPL